LAVAAVLEEARSREEAQVVRGVGDALADLAGDVLDRALALGEDVDDLGPVSIAHRLGDGGECGEERIFGLAITQGTSQESKFKVSLESPDPSPYIQSLL
jgi:hypothetical protein